VRHFKGAMRSERRITEKKEKRRRKNLSDRRHEKSKIFREVKEMRHASVYIAPLEPSGGEDGNFRSLPKKTQLA